MAQEEYGALILAAGKGTRMRSATPKVLQPLLGEPMLAYVERALRPLVGERIWAVVGCGAEAVRAAFEGRLNFDEQREQLGTGHALMMAMPALKAAGLRRVLVVNGDMPLVTSETLESFAERGREAAVAVASLMLDDPGAYGRIVRREGAFSGIVEAKDFDPSLHGEATGEINAGVYLLDVETADRLLPRLDRKNAGGEYYITDLPRLAMQEGLRVEAVQCGKDTALLGVNTPAELVQAEDMLAARIAAAYLADGVMIHNPSQVRIGPGVKLEPGAIVHGPCEMTGSTIVEAGASVGPFCVVKDSVLRQGVVVHPFSHLENAEVGSGCLIGPYARLRPGAVTEENVHVGNFVEIKKSRLGKGAKANHLTYLGDSEIGAGTNIGAGTITCNYDGVHKHKTIIGERAFIGSNTALVAPVTVGSGVLVAAGSVITKDVEDGMLAVARGRQSNHARKKKAE
ncbi:MAG: bifunctional UDP-N-acetylglucosamine diphosphorylase/glucosamine-1-phosphate N-acetyltransferase GlmU [Desulfovibrionaceae bacterium]|nr:bifunctional UDP-N-acetylglucosamine diphosphorylase/glucosamine-1-phosphate N-acetyltransferase GlmU [Desulfovibrionaceae bacterium]